MCGPRLKVLAVNYPDGEQRKRVEKLRLALLKEKEWSDTEYADILSKVPTRRLRRVPAASPPGPCAPELFLFSARHTRC